MAIGDVVGTYDPGAFTLQPVEAGTAPASNTTAAIFGGVLSANFNFKAFDAVSMNK